jgi:hypothetical protein
LQEFLKEGKRKNTCFEAEPYSLYFGQIIPHRLNFVAFAQRNKAPTGVLFFKVTHKLLPKINIHFGKG